MDINIFIQALTVYVIELVPALALGFFISGLIHEFIPEDLVEGYLAKGGFLSIFWATLLGTLLPVCCCGSLAVGISLYKKGARLGPVLAFLVATPATSIPALLVTYRLLGLNFAVYIFFAAIVLGLIMGLVGNLFHTPVPQKEETAECPPECGCSNGCCGHEKHTLVGRVKSVLHYAFWEMPREIGFELMVGLVLAALILSVAPLEQIISQYLGGALSYAVALPFALIMYICSTATPPLVHALVNSGMNVGAGMLILLVGPVTSLGTILVIKKEFGPKILLAYLAVICVVGLILGWGFSVFNF